MIDKIASDENLSAAIDKLCKRKSCRRWAREAMEHKEELIREVRELIVSGTYVCGKAYHQDRIEGGKRRSITYTKDVKDQIVRHAVSRKLSEVLIPKMHKGVSSSIEGRGSHYCMMQAIESVQKGGYIYYLQEDVKGFFGSVDKPTLLKTLQSESGCDDATIALVAEMTSLSEHGIAIGTVDCQLWSNVHLMPIDRQITERHGSDIAYLRYCDNITVLGNDVMLLHRIHQEIAQIARRLKLRMNPCLIGTVEHGIRVLSAVIYPTHVRIRKRVVESMKRSDNAASYFGFIKIGNTHNLVRKYMYNKFADILDIPEYITSFTGDKREMSSLVGKRIYIMDCRIEQGKFTDREGKHRDRAKIAFKFNEGDVREYICFSSSKPIMHYCRAFEADKAKYLPMEVVIERTDKQYKFKAYED